MTLLGIILLIFGFIATLALPGFRFLGMFFIFISIIMIRVAAEIKEDRRKKELIKNLYNNGSIIGKDLQYIEKYLGPHTSVNISNDNNRIYIWDDYFEILCNKDNKCKEILKDSTKN